MTHASTSSLPADYPRLPIVAAPHLPKSPTYARFDGQHVIVDGEVCDDDQLMDAHEELRDHVLAKAFPCVGALSAFNRRNYRFGLFESLGSLQSADALCESLYRFSEEFRTVGSDPLSFIALFDSPGVMDEADFERRLWQQLQHMHDIDAHRHDWAAGVDRDSASASFSFSIGGRAWFVVGLHPGASRLARRIPRPALVFNFHEQFEHLKTSGKYDLMKAVIRARDLALQGTINPVLARFGESSEARQYSGRAVDDAWRCPFQARGSAN